MTDWAIPQQAKLKYTQLFNFHDRSRSGFLSGLQCRDILLQSGLPRNILAEIWNLSDIDGDGQLTREEFILAMHLTNHVRSGQNLPAELPADLIPPSYRRTRSISATSVHSVASAGSSASANNDDQTPQKSSDMVPGSVATSSVLNSNSFEDKRRENFEKGRAELERRRLRIIEQQSSILREQLAVGKKQVTEAKTKIDSMRTERDTKAGLITTLEAQLKTLQDRKSFLNHEELNLIAIAKDLNLVNPAQVELDQLATQAKLQSIAQMKEKIEEFAREKEAKAKELADVLKRLEESKKQLRSVFETVNKTYELYKEKVVSARSMREQFVKENKSKAIDLDSVWDSSPSFPNQPPTNLEPTSLKIDDDPWNPKPSQVLPNTFEGLSNNDNNAPNDEFNLNNKTTGDGNGFVEKTKDLGGQQIKRYRAIYAFEARNPDELTINPGDIITGSDTFCEPGWLSGESNGRNGLFPEAYVEPLIEEAAEINSSGKNLSDKGPISVNDEFLGTKKPSSSVNGPIKYKVVYAFEARNPDELTINPGDIVYGSDGAYEPGWLMGDLNGQKGLIPEAYVERIVETVQEQAEVGVSYKCLIPFESFQCPLSCNILQDTQIHSLSLSHSFSLLSNCSSVTSHYKG